MRLCNFAPIKFSYYGNEQIKGAITSEKNEPTRVGYSHREKPQYG